MIAAARMMSPRPGLIPGTRRARTPAGRERLDELADRVRRDHEALDADVELAEGALGRGGEVPHGAADAGQVRTGARQPVEHAERLAHVSRTRLEVLLLGGPVAGEETARSAGPRRAGTTSSPRRRSATAMSCMLPPPRSTHDAVGQRRGVDGGDVAVESLVALGEDLDLDAGRLAWRGRGTRRWLAASRIALVATAWIVARGEGGWRGRSGRTPTGSQGRGRSPPR